LFKPLAAGGIIGRVEISKAKAEKTNLDSVFDD
jgi:hypothetical protein